jgi:membrane protein YqaA with SNARE-associated domain
VRRRLILAAGLGSLALLLGAWVFQAMGYAPCKMCLWQRWPHGAAVAIAVVGYLYPVAAVALLGALAALTTSVIGASLFESVGRPVLEFYGKDAYFETFRARYNEYGAWAVLIAGVTPFPYKVITILSGTTGLSLTVFMVASVVARGLRFFVVAALLWKFGEPIREFIERRLGLLFTVFCLLLVGGFVVLRFL